MGAARALVRGPAPCDSLLQCGGSAIRGGSSDRKGIHCVDSSEEARQVTKTQGQVYQ